MPERPGGCFAQIKPGPFFGSFQVPDFRLDIMTRSKSRKLRPDKLPDKLLVTGVDAMLGSNLALSLCDRFAVVGVLAERRASLDLCRTVRCDPAKPSRLAALVRREAPRWIIHCGPLSRGSWDLPCECPDGQQEANTCTALAAAAEKVGSSLTVISSDAVFAGPRMFHNEQAPTTSRLPFGQAAREVEKVLEGSIALMVRTHAYGWSPAGGRSGLAERVCGALAEGNLPVLDPDRHATPILSGHLAEILLLAYRRGVRGLCHIAGAERTSEYRFAGELAIVLGLGNHRFPVAGPQPPGDEPEHLDETSLCTRRARRELKGAMPVLREGLERFAEQAANGFRARLQSAARKTPRSG